MERIWLKSYPPGVPADIDPSEFRSLVELFEVSVRKYAERPAYHSMGKTLTFGELDRLSRDFGAWLQARGLAKGARVAIMMPNCLQYPVAMFGTLRAGYTVVNVNPLYTARELEHQLKDAGAEAIVVLENFGRVLQEVRHKTPVKHVVVTSLGEMLGLKGLIVNLVVRKVKKMVPPFELPGSISMKQALQEAQKAFNKNEIPVGAVVVSEQRVIARAHNLTELLNDVTAHAEMQVITSATNVLGGKYLTDCTLYVTVEPCPMCAGALRWAQLSRLVYGASDEKRGYSTISPFLLHPKTTVTKGVMANECSELMQTFFKNIR